MPAFTLAAENSEINVDATAVPMAPAPEVPLEIPEGDEVTDEAAVTRLRAAMTDGVGVVRTAAGLKAALRTIAEIEAAATGDSLRNMTATATLIAAAALAREESRGGHFRADFPQADPTRARRTRITLDEACAIRARAMEKP